MIKILGHVLYLKSLGHSIPSRLPSLERSKKCLPGWRLLLWSQSGSSDIEVYLHDCLFSQMFFAPPPFNIKWRTHDNFRHSTKSPTFTTRKLKYKRLEIQAIKHPYLLQSKSCFQESRKLFDLLSYWSILMQSKTQKAVLECQLPN